MGANDLATGGYCGETRYNKGELGYINGLFTNDTLPVWRYYTQEIKEPMPATSSIYTSNELDRIWKERSLNWIKNNMPHFIGLSFIKIQILFKRTPIFLYKYEGTGIYYTCKSKPLNYILEIISTYFFYFLLLLSFSGLLLRKTYKQPKIILYVIIILYIAVICVTCASARYNMVIQPFIVISATLAAYKIMSLLKVKIQNKYIPSSM